MSTTNTSNPHVLRIAVMSDLHAYDESNNDPAPSHLRVGDPEESPNRHPIAGLVALIQQEQIEADVLLCPGDLGDKARPVAIKYAWDSVHRVGQLLGASLIAATAGNHDVDSRYVYNKQDAKGYLQTLLPVYPLASEDQNDKYWSRHFILLEEDSYRIVVLNSSAFHGGGESEYQHGRISPHTLEALTKSLDRSTNKGINVLLCHHHPQQHSEVNLGDYDVMKDGQLLLDVLGTGRYGEWLIIHGHKHHPKLSYASGNNYAPVVFSAGSLCATLYPELQTVARNQFYLIELPHDPLTHNGLMGTFRAWDWIYGHGWRKAGSGSGLPAAGGFGWRGKVSHLATRISDTITTSFTTWDNVTLNVQDVQFILPSELKILIDELSARHGLQVNYDEYGNPSQIGRTEE